MSAEDYVVLEWSYTPANFFEEPIYVPQDDCEIRIEGGKATATIDPDCYDAEHKKRDELHEVVDAYFRARQVVTHKAYNLPKPSVARLYPDGRVVPTVLCGISMSSPLGEVRILASTGDGVAAEACRFAFGDAVARVLPRDPVLRKLLDSYQTAVDDPDDELVHLYEIRDALSAHFGGERKAKVSLRLTDSQWKPLGRLACDEPVKQGRHRGAHLEPLRKATAEELREARSIARGLIEAYVRWADRSPDE